MAESVALRTDNKLPLIGVFAALVACVGFVYNLQTRVALVEATQVERKESIQALKNEIHTMRSDADASREKMREAVERLNLSLVRFEEKLRGVDEKLDRALKQPAK